MAKKKKKEPTNILTIMYQDGYKRGYADGIAHGKKLIFDEIQVMLDKKDHEKPQR